MSSHPPESPGEKALRERLEAKQKKEAPLVDPQKRPRVAKGLNIAKNVGAGTAGIVALGALGPGALLSLWQGHRLIKFARDSRAASNENKRRAAFLEEYGFSNVFPISGRTLAEKFSWPQGKKMEEWQKDAGLAEFDSTQQEKIITALMAAESEANQKQEPFQQSVLDVCQAVEAYSCDYQVTTDQVRASLEGSQGAYKKAAKDSQEAAVNKFNDSLETQLTKQGLDPSDSKLQAFITKQKEDFATQKANEQKENDDAFTAMRETVERIEKANICRIRQVALLGSKDREAIVADAGYDPKGGLSRGGSEAKIAEFNINQAFLAQDVKHLTYQIGEDGKGHVSIAKGASPGERKTAMRSLANFNAAKFFDLDNTKPIEERRKALAIPFWREGATKPDVARRALRDDVREYIKGLMDAGVNKEDLPKEMPISINGKKEMLNVESVLSDSPEHSFWSELKNFKKESTNKVRAEVLENHAATREGIYKAREDAELTDDIRSRFEARKDAHATLTGKTAESGDKIGRDLSAKH